MSIFLKPWWLLAIFPLLLIIIWIYYRQTKSHNWHKVCDAELLKVQLISIGDSSIIPIILLGLAWLIAVVALAGPSWTTVKSPIFKSSNTTVILLELSQEMMVQDPNPNRLTRAKYKISDLLRSTNDRQYGLAVYSSEPFTVSPVTSDGATIDSLLSALDPSLLPIGGRNIVFALDHAKDLLVQSGQPKGNILLVTTGNVNSEVIAKAAHLKHQGITTSVLGVGSAIGGPIPESTGFLKDGNNKVVLSKLNRTVLEKLAKAGGGIYKTLSHDQLDLNSLVSSWNIQAEKIEDNLSVDRRRNDGYWLLWILIPLISLVFSVGWRNSII